MTGCLYIIEYNFIPRVNSKFLNFFLNYLRWLRVYSGHECANIPMPDELLQG